MEKLKSLKHYQHNSKKRTSAFEISSETTFTHYISEIIKKMVEWFRFWSDWLSLCFGSGQPEHIHTAGEYLGWLQPWIGKHDESSSRIKSLWWTDYKGPGCQATNGVHIVFFAKIMYVLTHWTNSFYMVCSTASLSVAYPQPTIIR